MSPRLYDAHNHLQDARLDSVRGGMFALLAREGVARVVVNGSCEEDWPQVAELARQHPVVQPSFGYHPWYVRERTPQWRERLTELLDEFPSAGIGEIGLDRWIENPDEQGQEECFVLQLRLAAERNLPASIHCLRAWGWLEEILRREKIPARGFLLHSYGGSREMVKTFSGLGARFSLCGYFAQENKQRKREAFLAVPLDRLLIETDAPDMPLPAERVRFQAPPDSSGKVVNHPANLRAVYEFAAELYSMPIEQLAAQVERNFQSFFGATG